MCNIAGYVGNRPAAPILIEMLRKQEGLDAGFYTGMATIHEGKIYYAKLVGDLDRLLANTNAASLPGTIGIIHSRTPGDTGDNWAHPFTCEKDGEVKTAFVCNGWIGCCRPKQDGYVAIAEELVADGYELKSAVPTNGGSLTLSNGDRVHLSDVMTQLVSRRILNGMNTVQALEESYCQMPKENIGLLLSLAEPDAISWVRTNFPMHVTFTDDGAYLATSPHCFPDSVTEPVVLPLMSAGLIRRDGFTCKAFAKPPFTVAPFTAGVRARTYEGCCELLRQGHVSVPKLGELCETMFDKADAHQRNLAVYTVLYDLHKQGKLVIEKEYQRGVFEGLQAPIYYLSLKE